MPPLFMNLPAALRSRREPTRTAESAIAGHRSDIDGLRALAILLVVVYHVWLGRVSGGVDVFLMVSAFFLTATFVRRAQEGRAPDLSGFWLRRFRRLLPAAAITITSVLVVALIAYPQTEWPRVWREAWSSLFYVENWTLAFSEVDYYARASVTPSPFQHFWSLSVQGQVFVLWPIIFALVWLLFRDRRGLIVPVLATVFGVIFAGSLAFSIAETAQSQTFAYFDTRTRLWEFAAGSLVALVLPLLRVPRVLRAVAGWTGVVGIVVCGAVIDVQGGFPGFLALWPVVCTALVIIAGREPARGGPSAFLSSRPFALVSRDAYALYLVHWPVLVSWMVISERSDPGPAAGLAIIALSFVLARLLSALVERPSRQAQTVQHSRVRGAVVLAVAVLIVAVPLSAWQITIHQRTAALVASADGGYPGAAQIDTPVDLAGVTLPLLPAATALDDEWVELGEECRGALAPADTALIGTCTQTTGADDPAAHRVLVMGDSHAQQLTSPLAALAEDEGWGVVALLKGGCAIGSGAPSWSTSGVSCDEWRTAAVKYAATVAPDAVYLVVTRADPVAEEVLVEGIGDIAAAFTAQGIEVIAVRDTPRFDFDMYACVVTAPQAEQCDIEDIGFADEDAMAQLGSQEGVTAVDVRPWLCPGGICRGVIGNIAVYLDDNHLSASYGRTLAPMVKEMLGVDAAADAAVG